MIEYKIYTDGSCRANGDGGIGVVWLKNGKKVFEYSKGFKGVTNNIMELTAIYAALKSIRKEIDSLEIISDSEYSLGCIFNSNWKPKKNVDLINKTKKQLEKTQKLVKSPIQYRHTRGHQKIDSEDARWNNQCDWLAQTSSIQL